METQQQQQQYYYQYQTQPQTQTQGETTALAPQSYDPSSQVQSYDQSSQAAAAYYGYQPHHYTQQQQQQPQTQQQADYSSYYYPDYSNSYQTHYPNHSDPNSIHPPGVPISSETNPVNSYYPPAVVSTPQVQPSPYQGYMPPGQSAYMGGGGHAGRSARGGGRGGRRGGRGGTRSKQVPSQTAEAAQPTASSSVKPAPQMAWCELCRVDCNTLEILEQHKNGKRHKKNLKVYEELQNLGKHLTTVQNPQNPSQPEGNQLPNDNTAPQPALVENKGAETSGALRGGLKRKPMRGGGRGAKWVRGYDGSRRPVEPPKPKQAVPLICDLCNVKCESQVVFQSHIAGKKHLATVKRFQGHKEVFGEAIQAMYPTIPNLPSTAIVSQGGPQAAPQDAQALAAMMLNQQGVQIQDPQAAQAALAQLLSQHGIHDAQTLIAQLIPYMLAQFQVPGSVPAAPVAGLGMDAPLQFQGQGTNFPTGTGAENQNVAAENTSVTVNGKPGEEPSLQNQVEGPPQNTTAGAEKVLPVPGKEEVNVSHDEKSK